MWCYQNNQYQQKGTTPLKYQAKSGECKSLRVLSAHHITHQSFCYCKRKATDSMVQCERCNEWYHFSCLGLSDQDVDNIDHFYCNECLNRNTHLTLAFKTPKPAPLLHCYCQEKAYGNMVECTRCRLASSGLH